MTCHAINDNKMAPTMAPKAIKTVPLALDVRDIYGLLPLGGTVTEGVVYSEEDDELLLEVVEELLREGIPVSEALELAEDDPRLVRDGISESSPLRLEPSFVVFAESVDSLLVVAVVVAEESVALT